MTSASRKETYNYPIPPTEYNLKPQTLYILNEYKKTPKGVEKKANWIGASEHGGKFPQAFLLPCTAQTWS